MKIENQLVSPNKRYKQKKKWKVYCISRCRCVTYREASRAYEIFNFKIFPQNYSYCHFYSFNCWPFFFFALTLSSLDFIYSSAIRHPKNSRYHNQISRWKDEIKCAPNPRLSSFIRRRNASAEALHIRYKKSRRRSRSWKKKNELKPGEEGDERKGLRRVSVRAVIKIQLDCFPLIISFVFLFFSLVLYIPF